MVLTQKVTDKHSNSFYPVMRSVYLTFLLVPTFVPPWVKKSKYGLLLKSNDLRYNRMTYLLEATSTQQKVSSLRSEIFN